MDRSNFLIGIALLILAFVLMFQQQPVPDGRPPIDNNSSANAGSGQPARVIPPTNLLGDVNGSRIDANGSVISSTTLKTAPSPETLTGGLTIGMDDPIEISFTNHGGAIREIRLKKTDRVLKGYDFKYENIPALHLNFEDSNWETISLDGYEPTAYQLEPDSNASRVTFKNAWKNKAGDMEIRREYWRVKGEDPYLIHHRTTVFNRGGAPLDLSKVRLQVGTARPIKRIYNLFDDSIYYLNVGYYNSGMETDVGCRCANCSGRIDGAEDEFWQTNEILSGGKPTFDQYLTQAKWACVNNRFFANVLRPVKEPRDAMVSGEVLNPEVFDVLLGHFDERDKGAVIKVVQDLTNLDSKEAAELVENKQKPIKDQVSQTEAEEIRKMLGRVGAQTNLVRNSTQQLSGSFAFPFGSIPAGSNRPVEVVYYAGPKDYNRLQALEHEQRTVMQFGIFWWVSEPLNALLNMLQGWLGGFGSAIILMTIIVKLILWPLTSKSIRSQKKMQALQEPMQALKERYKNNPQKMNQEMMKFYKEHGVNPLAGCWPMLIQMPIFLGLFWMLRSAAELQGASFLWVDDLSEQDNIATFGAFSLNLLPVFMVATQIIQMKLTPMNLGPSASDQQRIQAKMMRMMPYMFLVFLYFFSSALVLYWTVQNILSITQTLITKRGDTSPVPATPTLDPPKKTKNLDPLQHISPEERDHRKALGLRLRGELNKKEIKTAFKKRVERYHPDKIRNLGKKRQLDAESKRQKLEKAYEFLLNKD